MAGSYLMLDFMETSLEDLMYFRSSHSFVGQHQSVDIMNSLSLDFDLQIREQSHLYSLNRQQPPYALQNRE